VGVFTSATKRSRLLVFFSRCICAFGVPEQFAQVKCVPFPFFSAEHSGHNFRRLPFFDDVSCPLDFIPGGFHGALAGRSRMEPSPLSFSKPSTASALGFCSKKKPLIRAHNGESLVLFPNPESPGPGPGISSPPQPPPLRSSANNFSLSLFEVSSCEFVFPLS